MGKNKSGLQTKTEGNVSNIRELRYNRNTTLKCNTHRNELLYENGHFSDLVQGILRKKYGGLNLVLLHAKPPALMSMLIITLKWQYYKIEKTQYKHDFVSTFRHGDVHDVK